MRRLLLCTLLSFAACDPKPTTVVEPFPVPRSLDGTWRVTNLERIDDGPALPIDPADGSELFRPIFEGMDVTITGGQVRDREGAPLFAQFRDGATIERYTNVAANGVVVFDFASGGASPCAWREELTIQGVAVGDAVVSATVRVISSSACPESPALPEVAIGTFRCSLQLVALPAQHAAPK